MPERSALRPSRRRGFTLIEALLAGMILAVFGTALAAGIGLASTQLQRDRDTVRAANALDEVLTRVALVGPATLALDGPTQGQLNETFEWSVVIDQQPLSDLFDITATVMWTRRDRPRSVSASTRLYDPPSSSGLPWEALSP